METMSEIPKFQFLNKLSPSDTSVIKIQEGKLKFEYNILTGEDKVPDENEFIQTIGDILTKIIMEDDESRTVSTKTSDQ